jgi:exo-1,4-beta-D-glucosaminidase
MRDLHPFKMPLDRQLECRYLSISSIQIATNNFVYSIYWMMNGAWPNLHWQLFDYYLNPAGSYFGTKVGARPEHVSFNYENKTVSLINRLSTLVQGDDGSRSIAVDLVDTAGHTLSHKKLNATTKPNYSQEVANITENISNIHDVAFLRLVLSSDSQNDEVLSRNVYWLAAQNDVLQWNGSNWYYTPIDEYADYTSLQNLTKATLVTDVERSKSSTKSTTTLQVQLKNKSTDVPAFFIQLVLIDADTNENINPPFWSDNYVTLFPEEALNLTVSFETSSSINPAIEISGGNIATHIIAPD